MLVAQPIGEMEKVGRCSRGGRAPSSGKVRSFFTTLINRGVINLFLTCSWQAAPTSPTSPSSASSCARRVAVASCAAAARARRR